MGSNKSIVDLMAAVPIDFVVAGRYRVMEGNGPGAGSARRVGRIVLFDDPTAADATWTRMMGLVPDPVPHFAETAKFLGNMSCDRMTN